MGEVYRRIARKLDVDIDDAESYDYTCYRDPGTAETIHSETGMTWPKLVSPP